jgi:hypothetical protein
MAKSRIRLLDDATILPSYSMQICPSGKIFKADPLHLNLFFKCGKVNTCHGTLLLAWFSRRNKAEIAGSLMSCLGNGEGKHPPSTMD